MQEDHSTAQQHGRVDQNRSNCGERTSRTIVPPCTSYDNLQCRGYGTSSWAQCETHHGTFDSLQCTGAMSLLQGHSVKHNHGTIAGLPESTRITTGTCCCFLPALSLTSCAESIKTERWAHSIPGTTEHEPLQSQPPKHEVVKSSRSAGSLDDVDMHTLQALRLAHAK